MLASYARRVTCVLASYARRVQSCVYSPCRQDQAELLGYPNFAEMSMETKMAGSVDNVMSMITTLMSRGE